MHRASVLLWAAVTVCLACGDDESGASAPSASQALLHSCDLGAELTGAAYDIEKSKFALGSAPTKSESGGLTRWTGANGVIAVFPNGSTLASLNAGVAEANVKEWSSTHETVSEHVRAYFLSMGVAPCQSTNTQALGGSSGIAISLNRAVAGVPVIGSVAYAQFNEHDLTTTEGFYWPTVPASVVTAARALQTQLAEPAALASYKAKLPTNAQGEGQVVIHHAGGSSTQVFAAQASYDVIAGRSTLSFDANGAPLTPPQ
jgi:hypothetical protein